jgi:SET domain-containing protein
MIFLETHLVVKRSTIPKTGKGLFTKIYIPRGTLIVEYEGKVTSWKEVNDDNGRNRYIYYINRHKVINAKDDTKALARFANDSRGPNRLEGIKNNSMYAVINDRVYIRAIKNITAGSEILVGYGKSYWDILKENKVI